MKKAYKKLMLAILSLPVTYAQAQYTVSVKDHSQMVCTVQAIGLSKYSGRDNTNWLLQSLS